MKKVILGSQSPRRKEILQFFSLPFEQHVSHFDEEKIPFRGDPIAYAREISEQKALALSSRMPDAVVITADTVVHLSGRLFAKPANLEEARLMLRALAGHEHQVFTAVSVAEGMRLHSGVEETRVTLCDLTDAQIDQYIEAAHPFDKAGGYAIQRGGSLIVKRIEGCYYNVMGLPLHTLRRQLLNAGIDLWDFIKPFSP